MRKLSGREDERAALRGSYFTTVLCRSTCRVRKKEETEKYDVTEHVAKLNDVQLEKERRES